MSADPSADSGPRRERRPSGRLQGQIVTVLVEARVPLTPGEVRDRLPELSYSTVVTILTRLYRKGVVTRRRDGRAYRYEAVADAATLVAGRMSRLLAAEPDRASVLRRFVSTLDAQDEALLRALLRDPED
ncbi:BlaI/MecI/CopY family transcriptional regulator [Actinocorallia sp. A-T 12471]|uniref:BlaI/MecI/CopY family transcriptional regulator n=1 Tax=Actinocorallia sp. A-T 12471 TaxID=3089813 RepID=UPI0029D3789D|nr:BlaI/MecI/CopY family transcriptional regulator [Actinocorallia sp. A-T 12471]MDX6740853.1 BlaI/MecI/CopY family transcriptional regulator [Actinocorallia sp. A-T 12471]